VSVFSFFFLSPFFRLLGSCEEAPLPSGQSGQQLSFPPANLVEKQTSGSMSTNCRRPTAAPDLFQIGSARTPQASTSVEMPGFKSTKNPQKMEEDSGMAARSSRIPSAITKCTKTTETGSTRENPAPLNPAPLTVGKGRSQTLPAQSRSLPSEPAQAREQSQVQPQGHVQLLQTARNPVPHSQAPKQLAQQFAHVRNQQTPVATPLIVTTSTPTGARNEHGPVRYFFLPSSNSKTQQPPLNSNKNKQKYRSTVSN
jgi:hypothetical protein